MPRRKCDLWKVAITTTSMLLLLMLMAWIPVSAADAYEGVLGAATPGMVTVQTTPSVDATVTALNKEQLSQQVAGQQRTLGNWLWSNAATILSSFLSTLVIVIGALVGLWRWRMDRRAAQKKELEDRQAERERRDEEQQRWLKDRKAEREKRAEERFQAVVEGLGNQKNETRVGAAIMLRTFLSPGYEEFFTQAYDLAVAHLRLRSHDSEKPEESIDSVSQALVTVFREAFPNVRKNYEDRYPEEPHITRSLRFDASHAQLDNAYLYLADLVEIRMLDASLRKANLSRAQLVRANLTRANLHRATMVGTDLHGANLSNAKLMDVVLRDALLKGTDLKYADLSGADLWHTNIVDALSLKETNLRGVKNLPDEQKAKCKANGAIIDEEPMASASQSTVAPSSSSQSNDVQALPVSSVQESLPPPDTDTSSVTSPQQETES